jgi:hypothetical protein
MRDMRDARDSSDLFLLLVARFPLISPFSLIPRILSCDQKTSHIQAERWELYLKRGEGYRRTED